MAHGSSDDEHLTSLVAGMPLVYGGDRVTHVSERLAADFAEGDRLLVLQDDGEVLHIPAEAHRIATEAVTAAAAGFAAMADVTDAQVTDFYEHFAGRLDDDATFGPVADANAADLDAARSAGRSTTRLVLSPSMRRDMVEGLRLWRDTEAGRDEVLDTVVHEGWELDRVRSALGVVAFIFEGRPNVFADATGVLRSGNTVVFRIGSDALRTARAIVEHALAPALAAAGLPAGAVVLVDSASRAAGHALFSDSRLSLAVARGSGAAVAQLGAVARQAGIPVSLHGTGGAWLVVAEDADEQRLALMVRHSLDRKVCNTLNTCCVVASAAPKLVPVVLEALASAAAAREAEPKLHVTSAAAPFVPDAWRGEVTIDRAGGAVREPMAEPIGDDALGVEWEWETSPEITLHVVADLDEAVRLCNEQSPRFVASLASASDQAQQRFFANLDAPFVGDGFTRWVDGQYALDKPELGLSNWQGGRLLGRAGILSGDSVHTVRLRMRQSDADLHR